MTVGDSPFWLKDQLGFTVTGADGHGFASLDCDERHHNPHGVVHGAVIFAMVDTAMGAAVRSILDEGTTCATIDIGTRFLAPVLSGHLDAEVDVLRAGRRIVQLEAKVFDESRRLVATASGAFAVIPPRD